MNARGVAERRHCGVARRASLDGPDRGRRLQLLAEQQRAFVVREAVRVPCLAYFDMFRPLGFDSFLLQCGLVDAVYCNSGTC